MAERRIVWVSRGKRSGDEWVAIWFKEPERREGRSGVVGYFPHDVLTDSQRSAMSVRVRRFHALFGKPVPRPGTCVACYWPSLQRVES